MNSDATNVAQASSLPPQKWALITGASSGIGYELAKIFSARGHPLVLVARQREPLQKVADELGGNAVKILARDLSERNAPREIFDHLQRENIFVSVLVNNAGFGRNEFFADTALAEQLEMIDLNVSALTHLTHLFLQPMIARREGKILNVASTAAFQPGPAMSVYYASKAFVFSFSYALAEELEKKGITVTTLCPGPTQTGFQKRAGRFHSQKMLRFWTMSAEAVAQQGFEGLMKGKRVVIPGWLNKLGYFFAKHLPVQIPTRASARIIGGKN